VPGQGVQRGERKCLPQMGGRRVESEKGKKKQEEGGKRQLS